MAARAHPRTPTRQRVTLRVCRAGGSGGGSPSVAAAAWGIWRGRRLGGSTIAVMVYNKSFRKADMKNLFKKLCKEVAAWVSPKDANKGTPKVSISMTVSTVALLSMIEDAENHGFSEVRIGVALWDNPFYSGGKQPVFTGSASYSFPTGKTVQQQDQEGESDAMNILRSRTAVEFNEKNQSRNLAVAKPRKRR